ncbi:hypothetical protein DAT35_11555 [Vitiosangium sp. GDMCC 1.1324]|nr:hypothetical protein DAT35_11555 [Vitiosangium sp. GDMCC 1.1324]
MVPEAEDTLVVDRGGIAYLLVHPFPLERLEAVSLDEVSISACECRKGPWAKWALLGVEVQLRPFRRLEGEFLKFAKSGATETRAQQLKVRFA